jgi:hypothetical protein
MTGLAVVLALAACGVSVVSLFARKPDEKTVKALSAAKDEIKELEDALVHLVDNEGNVHARLALPAEGQTLTSQRRDIKAAKEEMMTLRKEIREANEERTKVAATLVQVLDTDGEVLHSICVPGEEVHPNRTPCGDLCKHAFWVTSKPNGNSHTKSTHGTWNCRASQGASCPRARPQFLDGRGQCVMFVLDEN